MKKMNLVVALCLVAGTAVAAPAGTGKEVAKPGTAVDARTIEQGGKTEAGKKLLEKAGKAASAAKDKASEVATQAKEDLKPLVAKGKGWSKAMKQRLEKCVSGICEAFKSGEVSTLAEQGDPSAIKAMSEIKLNEITPDMTSEQITAVVERSMEDSGKNPKEIEVACKPK